MRAVGWQFRPAGVDRPTQESIAAAADAGPAALARELREARMRLGAARAAALLKAAEMQAGRQFGRPFRLLLATTQQPRALEGALHLGFAMAGFALELRAIEGIPALRSAISGQRLAAGSAENSPFEGIEAGLLVMPTGQDAPSYAALQMELAEGIAALSLAPVAVARFPRAEGPSALGAEPADKGVALLDIAVDTIFDERFGATFGAMLTAEAADRLADAAAGVAARLRGTAPKLVITDLDGTLWVGVLGEPGAQSNTDEISAAARFRRSSDNRETGQQPEHRSPLLHAAYAAALSELRKRGLVLAVASRNDPRDVDAALAAVMPADLDFAARGVGWADKPSLVATLLGDLGLAPEHAVFIDDDPVNCAAVAARFPAMDVRHFAGNPDAFAAELLADPLLRGNPDGGGERGEHYARRAAVEALRHRSADEAAFRASLGTRVTILHLDATLRPRAAELASRVNQFLLTGYRPNPLQLAARPGMLDFMARLDDAFGAHGLVGLVLASPQDGEAVIDNLFLSCRALQRGVEGAMLYALARRARKAGLTRIVARIEALPRNEPARGTLAEHGFVAQGDLWIYDLGLADGRLSVVPEGLSMMEPGESS